MAITTALRPTSYPHIYLDDQGREWIDDTNVNVVTVVLDAIGPNHLSTEEIRMQRPRLSLAQIHAALAYYHDNKAAVDATISRLDRDFKELRAQTEDQEHQARLHAIKEQRARQGGA